MKYIIYIGIGLVIIYALYYKIGVVEGYESLEECKKQGYAHDFCMRVPIQSMITTAADLQE
jgi:hypothetical protein